MPFELGHWYLCVLSAIAFSLLHFHELFSKVTSATQQFYKNFVSNFDVHIAQILDSEKAIDKNLKTIQKLKFRIIIVSLPMNSLDEVMYKRLSLGMTWPDYARLVLNFDNNKSIKLSCKNQVIVFQYYMKSSFSNAKVQIDYDKLIDISEPDYFTSKFC